MPFWLAATLFGGGAWYLLSEGRGTLQEAQNLTKWLIVLAAVLLFAQSGLARDAAKTLKG